MARYQVILAYDGTDFFGMQRQVETRTVQAVIEEALRVIGWQGKSIYAAGRTDSGVHASAQVVAFDLDWRHSEDDLVMAINANLPADVAAKSATETPPNFHPRFDALARRYRYRIYCLPHRDPHQDRRAWRVWPRPDFERMQTAAAHFIGEHDFAAFGTSPEDGGSTVRSVFEADWQQTADTFSFEIEANAFLYHMVRRIVHFQVQLGQGKKALDELPGLIDGQFVGMVQGLAPAQGLELIEVRYTD